MMLRAVAGSPYNFLYINRCARKPPSFWGFVRNIIDGPHYSALKAIVIEL